VIVGVAHALTAARRVREREAAAARADAARARAELSALRARLDPHFLFNTLHSVGALVRADSAAAESALERFADLLRYVLDAERGGRDDVALHDELAFVRSYLALEQLRLGERLQVVEEVDPDALECAVPPLTLQPLVENAIRHGLAPLARGGTLRVTAGFDGDLLALEVADDGAGADAATTSRAAGLGLSTVRQRLQGRWPEARTDVVTAPGEGFVVRLRLPARAHRPLAVHG
jgi:LytS/YehU family sensor histidine kinase